MEKRKFLEDLHDVTEQRQGENHFFLNGYVKEAAKEAGSYCPGIL